MSDEQPPERDAHAEALRLAPAAQDMWRVNMEHLDGLVAISMSHGWPEDQARLMVLHQFLTNLAVARRG